jgi:hypothetical protein
MVEFALIMPVLFMLIVGMLTGGVVMNRQLSLTHATREAARYGASVPAGQFDGVEANWAPEVRKIAMERSGDVLQDPDNVCVALIGVNASGVDYVASSTHGGRCINDGATGKRVQVTATLPDQEINGVLFSVPMTLTSDATAKHEE